MLTPGKKTGGQLGEEMDNVYVIILVTIVFSIVLPKMSRLVHFGVIGIVTPWMFLTSYFLLQEVYPSAVYLANFSEGFAWFMAYSRVFMPALCGLALWLYYIDRVLKALEEEVKKE